MASLPAYASGTFKIGGERTVHRLGFGAMRVTGPGIWGEPPDRASALATLRRLPELGVDFIDTADAYGPFVSEDLLREALYPYKNIVIATKGGQTRHGPNIWRALGRPEYLRQCVLMSLRRLGLERIELWQLHKIDTRVPREEQFGAIAEMRKEGLIHYVGLSNATIEDVELARKYFPVVTVQNRYNIADREGEDVLRWCEREHVGFIPWSPLSRGTLASPKSELARVAERLHLKPGQVALAWLLRRSPVMLPIPGTQNPAHLEENVAAAAVSLSDADFAALGHEAEAA